MSAPGVWTGLTDSAFLAGAPDRERDPGRLAATLIGGLALGFVAATCLLLLVLVAYAILTGQGARGLSGLGEVWRAFGDPQAAAPGLTVIRLIGLTSVDAVFWVVFVAFAALIVGHPLIAYLTSASHLRWRLLVVGMALAAAVMGPLVAAERLMTVDGPAPPFLSVSPLIGDRFAYALSSLLLIPAAAAEELFFRGWLLRQTGVFLRRPFTLIAVTALMFSALHLDFTPDAFLARTVMGAGFAYMTLRLGGIEFSTGAHAINNIMIVLFLQPLSADQAAGADISAYSLLEDLALVGGYVLITELVARSSALRWLAGVRPEEISPTRDISAHFS